MLTKKQLEDAAECMSHDCESCGVREFAGGCCQIATAQTALAYRDMLEEVIKHLSHCPFCKINRPWLYKHKDGCKLAALLKEGDE